MKEEILTNYVHHEITQNWILILLKVFCLIIIKYVYFFLFLKVIYDHKKKKMIS